MHEGGDRPYIEKGGGEFSRVGDDVAHGGDAGKGSGP